MSALQPVRGTRDIMPAEMRRHRLVVETARAVAERHGYQEMTPPVFEFTEIFKRTLGDTSDVVTKEMYTFAIGEGEQVTLRPEATAGVALALITLVIGFFAQPVFEYTMSAAESLLNPAEYKQAVLDMSHEIQTTANTDQP